MIAGTILVFGASGPRPGAGMRRGTIGLFGAAAPMLPTFRLASVCRPVFLRFYLSRLREMGFLVRDDCLAADYHRYCGDFLALGKGEILLRKSA